MIVMDDTDAMAGESKERASRVHYVRAEKLAEFSSPFLVASFEHLARGSRRLGKRCGLLSFDHR